MENIELQGDSITTRREWLHGLLLRGVYDVTFTKVNGETRIMPCTLEPSRLPPTPVNESAGTRKTKEDNISVWCVDKQEWRSFKVMNVQSIRKL